jgi:tetratricopeptide (TPR) repeat protein
MLRPMTPTSAGAALIAVLAFAAPSAPSERQRVEGQTVKAEATSLLGKPLHRPQQSAETRAQLDANLAAARADVEKDPSSADAAIWLGRRTAYTGRFRDAIHVYTMALGRHPEDPRLYRHRGHRYITVRELDAAVADLSRAAALVANRSDEVEPDGQPNARNIPTSTLKTNVYYHLGLGRYLEGEFERAADAYRLCMEHSKNADMQVATTHWQYMTLRRLNRREDAEKLLVPITAGMDVIENTSYHRLLLMYKGDLTPEALLAEAKPGGLDAVTIGYGVANWHLYNGRRDEALKLLREIVERHDGQWAAFGYIAAEAELARLR